MNQRYYWLIVVSIAVAFLSLRIVQLVDLEPRVDQAFTTSWVRALVHAERISPLTVPGAGFFDALLADESSALNILLRQIYLANDLLFTVVGLAWLFALSFLAGGSMEAQIIASILSGTLALVFAAGLPLINQQRPGRRKNVPATGVGLVFSILIFGNSYFHLYSAIGIHNLGVMTLVLGVVTAEIVIHRLSNQVSLARQWKLLAAFILVHVVACYSHYTNVFLLPAAMVLVILTNMEWTWRKRMQVAAIYSAGIVAAFLLAIALASLSNLIAHTDNQQNFLSRVMWAFPMDQISPANWPGRAVGWVGAMAETSSVPAVILGIPGLVFLARDRVTRLPLYLVSVHFGLTVLMPGFNAYDRLSAYALVFIYLGMAWSLVWCWQLAQDDNGARKRWRQIGVGVAACAMLFVHAKTQ